MDLTRSLCCRRLCFTNAFYCPHCGKSFQPGSLAAKAVAENAAFKRKGFAVFLAAFLIVPPALFLIHGYLQRSP